MPFNNTSSLPSQRWPTQVHGAQSRPLSGSSRKQRAKCGTVKTRGAHTYGLRKASQQLCRELGLHKPFWLGAQHPAHCPDTKQVLNNVCWGRDMSTLLSNIRAEDSEQTWSLKPSLDTDEALSKEEQTKEGALCGRKGSTISPMGAKPSSHAWVLQEPW